MAGFIIGGILILDYLYSPFAVLINVVFILELMLVFILLSFIIYMANTSFSLFYYEKSYNFIDYIIMIIFINCLHLFMIDI
jgi:hypothetical protein